MIDGRIPTVRAPFPGETAASIADAALGAARSGGDWSSLSPGTVPLACGTVSCDLETVLSCIPDGLVSRPDVGWEHTAAGYLKPGMSPHVFASFWNRLFRREGTHAYVRQPAWTGQHLLISRVCAICEGTVWGVLGRRAVLCDHQLPFVSACHAHGTKLGKRVAGAAPRAVRVRSVADERAVAFAVSSAKIRREGKDPGRLRERLRGGLLKLDYVRRQGTFKVRTFRRDLTGFAAERIVNASLRKLVGAPDRARQICHWVQGDPLIHPAYLAVLDMFLEEKLGDEHEV